MKSFKIDTHVHTREVSPCGRVRAKEVVDLYKQAGYYGIVITDHFYDRFFSGFSALPWKNQIDYYLTGYREALNRGREVGLQVILGIELRFSDSPDDYLVYGIDESFLKETPQFFERNIKEFKQIAGERNLLIYQAHPFRPGINVANPDHLDGVEVFNGNPRHDSRNELAYQFAQRNQLRMISGSDFHQVGDLGRGGITIGVKVSTSQELVAVLKTGIDIKLIGICS